MRPTLAIAWLTFREGLRMRVVLVAILLLLALVLVLPFTLRGDGTLAGRLQNFLSYSLWVLNILLSLAVAFLACATLTNEIKSCSIHTVVTKPVSRFQIVAGKWLGVNLLSLLLVLLCGPTIYGFARFIASLPEEFRRDRLMLRDVVWTARAAANPTDPEFRPAAEAYVDEHIQAGEMLSRGREAEIQERVKALRADWLRIPHDQYRVYLFDHLVAPKAENPVVQVRYRVRHMPLPLDEIARVGWLFLDPDSGRPLMPEPRVTEGRVGDVHEFLVRAEPVIKNGSAALVVYNFTPTTRLTGAYLFFDEAEDDQWLQVLYPVGSFEANFIKALLLIVFRVAFISAVGVFFGTFVSFPVACFCTLTALVICLGLPWWMESIGANLQMRTDDIDPYGRFGPYVRGVLVPILKVLFPDFIRYDGAGRLIDGRYIPPGLVGMAFAHTVALGSVLVLGIGWLVFRAREIAAVTV
jgi:hypothetical protein